VMAGGDPMKPDAAVESVNDLADIPAEARAAIVAMLGEQGRRATENAVRAVWRRISRGQHGRE